MITTYRVPATPRSDFYTYYNGDGGGTAQLKLNPYIPMEDNEAFSLPPGGTEGQVLTKISANDDEYYWQDNVRKIISGDGITISPTSGIGEVEITANVQRIIAGSGIAIRPATGIGEVKIAVIPPDPMIMNVEGTGNTVTQITYDDVTNTLTKYMGYRVASVTTTTNNANASASITGGELKINFPSIDSSYSKITYVNTYGTMVSNVPGLFAFSWGTTDTLDAGYTLTTALNFSHIGCSGLFQVMNNMNSYTSSNATEIAKLVVTTFVQNNIGRIEINIRNVSEESANLTNISFNFLAIGNY